LYLSFFILDFLSKEVSPLSLYLMVAHLPVKHLNAEIMLRFLGRDVLLWVFTCNYFLFSRKNECLFESCFDFFLFNWKTRMTLTSLLLPLVSLWKSSHA
jgi:hypothetical protein